MDQVATVVDLINTTTARLQIMPTAQCVKCGACGGLHQSRQYIEVKNTIGAAIGDQVVLSIEPSNLKIACFLYGIPTLLFLGGLVGGFYCFTSELAGMTLGIGMLCLALLPLRWFARRFQPRLLRLTPHTCPKEL
jgi:sigma-E factor negative regulatory protein RseC